jgi:hypothetical protein
LGCSPPPRSSPAIVAGAGGGLLAQVLAFAITGAVGLLIVRSIARRQMTHPQLVREGSYTLVGKACRATYTVSRTLLISQRSDLEESQTITPFASQV